MEDHHRKKNILVTYGIILSFISINSLGIDSEIQESSNNR